MTDLILHLKKEYWQMVAEGGKVFEFRLYNPYWIKRLVGKTYDRVIIARGYPSKLEVGLWLTFPYTGYEIKTIYHKQFKDGDMPVKVFAIKLVRE